MRPVLSGHGFYYGSYVTFVTVIILEVSRWLLLAYQLPSRPSHVRVKTWRRLQQIGAVSSRNSVYALPNTDQCREDFEWVRSEIVALGGEATVFAADILTPAGEDNLVAAFHHARTLDYQALKAEIDRLLPRTPRKTALTPIARRRLSRALHASRERLAELEHIDFFGGPGRQEVVKALAALEQFIAEKGRGTSASDDKAPALDPSGFHKRRWATRPRPGVDRMASAWLIRRYIDPKATFAFVENPASSDVPFDMYTGTFSHQGSLCTFETLANRFGLSDPVIVRIGHIVHDLDMKETRYAPAEAPAVGRLVDGLRQLDADDHSLLEHGITMFEALARSFETSSQRRASAIQTRSSIGSRRSGKTNIRSLG